MTVAIGRSIVVAAALAGALLLAHCGGEATEVTTILNCKIDGECTRFGASAKCVASKCASQGISCAEKGGLGPGDSTSTPSLPTKAAALDEWLSVVGSLTAGYCDFLTSCGDPHGGGGCSEGLPDLLLGTCCQATIDFYVSHRDAVRSCPSSSCAATGFGSYCPALAAVTFETICK